MCAANIVSDLYLTLVPEHVDQQLVNRQWVLRCSAGTPESKDDPLTTQTELSRRPVEGVYRQARDPRCTLVFGFLVSQSLCACTWPGSVPPAPPRLWAAAAPHLWSEASGPTRRRPWVRGSRGEYSSSAPVPLQRLERDSRRDPLGGLSLSVRLLCASTVAGESQGSGWGVS